MCNLHDLALYIVTKSESRNLKVTLILFLAHCNPWFDGEIQIFTRGPLQPTYLYTPKAANRLQTQQNKTLASCESKYPRKRKPC